RDLIAYACGVVDRLEVRRDKRLAVGFASRLFRDAGGDAHECEAAFASHKRGLLPPNQLLDLGEVASAFADAHQYLLDIDDDNPFRDDSTPHLSASRLQLFDEGREDLLGATVIRRIAKHLDECRPCTRALREVVGREASRSVIAV